jgi:ferredoxin--NADP+ reductase
LIAADFGTSVSGKAGPAGLDRLLGGRGVEIVTFRDWQKIEAAEAQRARDGSPREKFTSVTEMLAQLGIGGK